MNKTFLYLVIAVLIIVSVIEGYYVIHERNAKIALGVKTEQSRMFLKKTSPQGRPIIVSPGMKFVDSPFYATAYKIAPITGTLSQKTQIALTGWNMKTENLTGGDLQVTLSPLETGDVKQVYVVKPGDTLYFVEMKLADDATGSDKNRLDDMGVLVDKNGIVQ